MEQSILEHYQAGAESDRLGRGASRIERARTEELLRRFLPRPPAAILDVGGGPGAYASWLAELGYDVDLIDLVPLHVEQALEAAHRSSRPFTATVGDARSLDHGDSSYDAVLLLGPLYHLTERPDRVRALGEARRVARPGGVVVGAGVSRFASLLDGLREGLLTDPTFAAIVERDLLDGQHRNPNPPRLEWFTTAYFHHPHELAAEVADAGLELGGVFGVEGPGWLLAERWDDDAGREDILRAARAIEQEPGLLGVSAHLLVVARVPLG